MGSSDSITQVIVVHGLINSDPEFTERDVEMNGASDFPVTLFWRRAVKHRCATSGIASLRFDYSDSVYIPVGGT